MGVTHAGFASVLNLVHSIYKMSSHGVFTIIICKHKGYLSKTYVENTMHLCIEYSTKCYCWYCQLKLDYVCTSLQLFNT